MQFSKIFSLFSVIHNLFFNRNFHRHASSAFHRNRMKTCSAWSISAFSKIHCSFYSSYRISALVWDSLCHTFAWLTKRKCIICRRRKQAICYQQLVSQTPLAVSYWAIYPTRSGLIDFGSIIVVYVQLESVS